MSVTTESGFSQWAIVEVFGYQKYAGLVSEQTIGGCNFVRVDIPATPTDKAFTKIFGQGSIYAITIVEEDVARAAAESYRQRPVQAYELSEEIRDAMRHLEQQRAQGAMAIEHRGEDRLF